MFSIQKTVHVFHSSHHHFIVYTCIMKTKNILLYIVYNCLSSLLFCVSVQFQQQKNAILILFCEFTGLKRRKRLFTQKLLSPWIILFLPLTLSKPISEKSEAQIFSNQYHFSIYNNFIFQCSLKAIFFNVSKFET